MLEAGFRYLYQLGDGFVLTTNDIVLKKIYTGYPYPKFSHSQDDLLYDFYCMHYKSYSLDYYFRSIRDDLIAGLKTVFTDTDVITIEGFFYPSDSTKKFIFLQQLGDCSIFLGAYTSKLLQVPNIVVYGKSDDCYLLVPNKLISFVVNFVDFNSEVSHSRSLDVSALPITPNNIYIFPTVNRIDALNRITGNFITEIVNKIVNKNLNTNISIDFVNAYRKRIFYNIPNKYVNDYTSQDILKLYDNYKDVVTTYFRDRYVDIFKKYPFFKGNFKFRGKKTLLGLIFTKQYCDIDDSLFSPNILGKLQRYFLKYESGVAWLDAKSLFGDDYVLYIDLLKTLNTFGDFKYKKRLDAVRALGISDKTLTKHALLYNDKSSFLHEYFGRSFFNLENYYEFNIFIDKVEIINSHTVRIESSVLKLFYEEFKSNLNCSIEEFIEKNFEYYTYAGKIIGLAYNLCSLEVSGYKWSDFQGLTLVYG